MTNVSQARPVSEATISQLLTLVSLIGTTSENVMQCVKKLGQGGRTAVDCQIDEGQIIRLTIHRIGHTWQPESYGFDFFNNAPSCLAILIQRISDSDLFGPDFELGLEAQSMLKSVMTAGQLLYKLEHDVAAPG